MKNIFALFFISVMFFSLSAQMNTADPIQTGLLNKSLFAPDGQSYSFSSGFSSGANSSFSYSLMSASFTKNLNKNFILNYDINYLNTNLKNNFMIGGMGLTYKTDNLRFSLYMSKIFEKEDLADFNFNK